MHYVGVDVSKAALDASDAEGRSRTFANSASGIAQMQRWMEKSFGGVHVILEPTSTYHHMAVQELTGARTRCTVINPHRTKSFAQALGKRSKTDKVDAKLLASIGESHRPEPSPLPDKAREELKALRRHQVWIEKEIQRTRNRLEAAEHSPFTPKSVTRSLKRIVRDLEKQAQEAGEELEEMVMEDEKLAHQASLLDSVKGIGLKTAIVILSEMPDVDACKSARSWVAYAGLCPELIQSGNMLRSRLSRKGASGVRAALYMPAVAASRSNPAARALAERLAAKGKGGKLVITAVMNKLLRLCYGVLKSGRPFDPQLHLKPRNA